jgi:hypothetical protein
VAPLCLDFHFGERFPHESASHADRREAIRDPVATVGRGRLMMLRARWAVRCTFQDV